MAQFTNQASISYNGITVNSNQVTGEITQVVSGWKDATVGEYKTGDIITYIISIQNSGVNDIIDLTISDDLGTYPLGAGTVTPLTHTGDPVLYYINGIMQPTPTVTSGPPLSINNIRVPAGLNTILVYRASVNGYAPAGTDAVIKNKAIISSTGLADDIEAIETINFNSDPILTIVKALNPTSVTRNGQIVYTFTIQNTGSSAADSAADIIISDTFAPILTAPVSVTLNGATWPQTDHYTYDDTSGEFATIAGAVTVPAATFIQDPATGLWNITPGETIITISGSL